MATAPCSPDAILAFWFDEITPKQWWGGSPEFDQLIRDRFGATHRAAKQCELYAWRSTSEGRLAEIIVLDQFSRNIFRGKPEAFAQDGLALALAQTAISAGADLLLDVHRRAFMYMPFMHSESRQIHTQSLMLFKAEGMQDQLESAMQHQAIIERFGRYPHRNAVLGRQSTEEELAFLKLPKSSF